MFWSCLPMFPFVFFLPFFYRSLLMLYVRICADHRIDSCSLINKNKYNHQSTTLYVSVRFYNGIELLFCFQFIISLVLCALDYAAKCAIRCLFSIERLVARALSKLIRCMQTKNPNLHALWNQPCSKETHVVLLIWFFIAENHPFGDDGHEGTRNLTN